MQASDGTTPPVGVCTNITLFHFHICVIPVSLFNSEPIRDKCQEIITEETLQTSFLLFYQVTQAATLVNPPSFSISPFHPGSAVHPLSYAQTPCMYCSWNTLPTNLDVIVNMKKYVSMQFQTRPQCHNVNQFLVPHFPCLPSTN